MGAFSIWHWLVVLFLLSPLLVVLIGIAVMGLQRKVLMKHSPSGLVKKGYVGYCWTYLFLGWLVPVTRGEIGIGVLHLILTAISLGLFQFVMPFLYNKQFMTRHLTAGWALSDTEEANANARLKLGIAA